MASPREKVPRKPRADRPKRADICAAEEEPQRGEVRSRSGKGTNPEREFLLRYYKDLNHLTLLSPAAEYELARRIGIMEEVQWVHILSFAPLCAYWLDFLADRLGQPLPESQPLRDQAVGGS
jgi:hypothetical protein